MRRIFRRAYVGMPRLLQDRTSKPSYLSVLVSILVGAKAIHERQRYNFWIFLVVGMICVLGMLIPNTRVSSFFSSIYGEQLAFKTILMTFTACFLLVLLTFFTKGPQHYRGRRRHVWAYRLVERPALFGEDLSCVAAAVSLPLCIAVAIESELKWEHVMYPITLGLIALLFRGIPWMVYSPLYRSGNMTFDRVIFGLGATAGLALLWFSAGGIT
ncbi:hypothetical protein PSPTO_5565 [Pseudomonas syringae pv. tomato str. DC3000]|uniref:Uncharacterized protein n=3 Tax=Pseudomonas syringae group TaxID=136849 RepID=Q87TV6_PSESM|nr:hypothetical protein PSPTO_5565 [Pseudomonas syringae pv. tomato str. DC3000]MCF5221980.1 hypothetical protein [Pseudomonas syringae]MCF5242883.1 hypothetical protein [Pseudomonas syringae]